VAKKRRSAKARDMKANKNLRALGELKEC